MPMNLFLKKDLPLLIQGMTGQRGTFHTPRMRAYGTNVIAGVTPGKGGTSHLGLPIYNTVRDAQADHAFEASLVFVPPTHAKDALLEAIAAEIPLIICVTEGIPLHDMLQVKAHLKKSGSKLLGPNSPGLLIPGALTAGLIPTNKARQGSVGIVSRSGTLMYEAIDQLSAHGLGQSACVGIGGDPLHGTNFIDVLHAFFDDPGTHAILLIGEIGGQQEENMAAFLAQWPSPPKPIAAFITGHTAPPRTRLGHAGAILTPHTHTAQEKEQALANVGVHIIHHLWDIGTTMKKWCEPPLKRSLTS